MRTKLTEIISTMDQYNGIGEYMDDSFVNERYTPQPQHDEEQYTSQFYPEDDILYKEDEEEE